LADVDLEGWEESHIDEVKGKSVCSGELQEDEQDSYFLAEGLESELFHQESGLKELFSFCLDI